MEYFLGKNEIDKIKESSFNEINCVAQYGIQEDDFQTLKFSCVSSSKITIKDQAISCQKKDMTTKLFHLGNRPKLPSEFAKNEILQSSIEKRSDLSWKDRVQFEIDSNKCTLLSVCHKSDRSEYLKFDSGKDFIKLDHDFNQIRVVNFDNNYLAIFTGDFQYGYKYYQKESRPIYFILIKINQNTDQTDTLTEVYRNNLDEVYTPGFKIERMIFNINKLSPKLLLLMKSDTTEFLTVFNIKTLQFTSTFETKEFEISSLDLFYCYNNLHGDLIVLANHDTGKIHIVKESVHNCLYYHSTDIISLPNGFEIEQIFCSNNRNNEVIFYIYAEAERNTGDDACIFIYEVLRRKISIKNLCLSNGDQIRLIYPIFFNPTGEEVFILQNMNKLNVFVYKSKVKSLKEICQVIVLQHNPMKELLQMNLPKGILMSF